MSEYKFVDWVEIASKRNKQDIESYLKDINQPDLFEFIQHHTDEGFKALEAGVADDYRWNSLFREIKQAANAISEKDMPISLIAKAFYDLGRARESLDHPTHEEMADLYKSKVDSINREYPLRVTNLGREHAKKAAQIIAQKKWNDDIEQGIRIGDMCKIVDVEIITNHKEFMDYLPENTSDMKKWLRPIAPDWAKKGGRPRKRSKK